MKRSKKYFTTIGSSMAVMLYTAQGAFAEVGTDIYDGTTSASTINTAMDTILKIVGGIGASVFALAFMVIGLFLAFGSLNPQKTSVLWKAFFCCGGAAFVFFMAYALPAMIKGMAQ
ncbi:TrbC/VirB2 family protein [Paenibacillus abyssi]|uniref:Conjugal transfer protein TrbC n=1 Tax=Paenibacillus abyssi TaxID=1340531 RepID=A0A917LF23_9BACL|nr:TrbC/VirB2 family protein [Paenibacillus abyssi]GGG18144.1 hypothetical protein GCM10010916_38680 [Paenibacillus abyssi]